MKKREEIWEAERKKLWKGIEVMGKKLEKIEREQKEGERVKIMEEKLRKMEIEKKEGGNRREEIGVGEQEVDMSRKVREMERKLERKEREDSRENIIIKGLKKGDTSVEERVKEMMGELKTEVEIKGVKIVGRREESKGEMVIVKLGSIDQKRRVLERRGERIEEDWTWEERKRQWRLGQIADEERRTGRRVWLGYGKIWIKGELWKWEEREEKLKDGRGRIWGGEENEEEGREEERKGKRKGG